MSKIAQQPANCFDMHLPCHHLAPMIFRWMWHLLNQLSVEKMLGTSFVLIKSKIFCEEVFCYRSPNSLSVDLGVFTSSKEGYFTDVGFLIFLITSTHLNYLVSILRKFYLFLITRFENIKLFKKVRFFFISVYKYGPII